MCEGLHSYSDLEGQVLEEVGGPIRLARLVAGASVDPNSDRSGLGVGLRLGSNAQTVSQGRYLSSGEGKPSKEVGGAMREASGKRWETVTFRGSTSIIDIGASPWSQGAAR